MLSKYSCQSNELHLKTCARIQKPIYPSVFKMQADMRPRLLVFILRRRLVIILSINLEVEG